MSNISKKFDELPHEMRLRIADQLLAQQEESLSAIKELDKRLTNTNFLTNGGGAVATLAFLETGADSQWVQCALILFIFGVVSTGIELRAMLNFYDELARETRRKHSGFLNNELSVEECLVALDVGKCYGAINHYAGLISQICFIAGVLVGSVGILLMR